MNGICPKALVRNHVHFGKPSKDVEILYCNGFLKLPRTFVEQWLSEKYWSWLFVYFRLQISAAIVKTWLPNLFHSNSKVYPLRLMLMESTLLAHQIFYFLLAKVNFCENWVQFRVAYGFEPFKPKERDRERSQNSTSLSFLLSRLKRARTICTSAL